jgi:hypothetical protein
MGYGIKLSSILAGLPSEEFIIDIGISTILIVLIILLILVVLKMIGSMKYYSKYNVVLEKAAKSD